MKRFLLLAILFASLSLLADDAALLSGKWSVKKTGDQGQSLKQTVEIKGNKFTFEVLSGEDQLFLHAEGDFKLETLGPLKTARFYNIRAGQSANDLQEVNDERVNIYQLDGDSWTMASNFDKERQQKPSLDVYQRVKSATKTGTLVIDEVEMADTPQVATWFFCFEAKAGGESHRHYVKDKGYSKNSVTIPMALEVPKVSSGQKCTFKMQLDDIDEDTCTDEMDNRSTGEFTISERGSQSFKPESNWRYTIRWHLKN